MFGLEKDMSKGCREGIRMTPDIRRREMFVTLISQIVEWRCLSFLEARMLVVVLLVVLTGGEFGLIGAVFWVTVAELNCTAWLKDEMMIYVPLVAQCIQSVG